MWGIELRRNGDIPLTRQIYQSLKEQITRGYIPSGEALPSTRELAEQLGVSRNTVCEAYEMLLAEGYVVSSQGSPTRVAEDVCVDLPSYAEPLEPPTPSAPPIRANFQTGQPDLRHFPRFQWSQLLRKAYEEMPLVQFGYTGPEGLPKLREEIAAWLFRSKGLTVRSQDIFITAGATQALHLISEMLCHREKGIIIEDPCHMGMLRVLRSKEVPCYPVPVDEQGLQTEQLEPRNAGAIYVTPSHQFPLGGILPANRRAALVRFARENHLYIIEDDYDSEFRFCGEPVAPLYAMDPQRVIYVGTFSKILFPALRVGYAVLPPSLHRQWKYLRTHTDVQSPPFEQASLAEYLGSRKLDRHVQKMRRLYGERRKILLSHLKDTFGTGWRPWGDAAGLHIALAFQGMHFDHEFTQKAKQAGIFCISVDDHSICKGRHVDKLLLGYGHLAPDEILEGISLLYGWMKL
ncbi:PLP-dependent aminotransferase family protein [Heliobacterium chlorum]|uniref:PLP-dependent aminotransferase family protein n=1 Tax=Heliobacterium chlorum TaxID=2698 RepID=A0ABR7T8F1_HELCL|nr:PLP-dependent aminotransferase family protein [Heliobacterium chlorum]MBC9786189.1 PLP-dependent aminotransferase family protein [Heliobacterium chlorum]